MKVKLFSFIIKSDFGFFKKPDINNFYLTYNFIPRTTILGILGAILGLKGYNTQYEVNGTYPEYYSKLRELFIGIKPLGDFPYKKIINKYNNSTGHANKEQKKGTTLNISEQLLIKPQYKIYVGLPYNASDDLIKNFEMLADRIDKKVTVYTTYMGKNDFPISVFGFEKEKEELEENKSLQGDIMIETSFLVSNSTEKISNEEMAPSEDTEETVHATPELEYSIMENYPYSYDKKMQYQFNIIRYANKNVSVREINLDKGMLLKKDNGFIYLIRNEKI